MSYYNRTSGTAYDSWNSIDQHGNPLYPVNPGGMPYVYWENRLSAFPALELDSPYSNSNRAELERMGYDPLYGFYRDVVGLNIRELRYRGDRYSEEEKAQFNDLITQHRADMQSAYDPRTPQPSGSPFRNEQDWFINNARDVAHSANLARDQIVDFFDMENELLKVGYKPEEVGEILNASAISEYTNRDYQGSEREQWDDRYYQKLEEAQTYGGILDDFQKAYDKKAVEYHEKNFAKMVFLNMLSPDVFLGEFDKLSTKDQHVYLFKALDAGMFDDNEYRDSLKAETVGRTGDPRYTEEEIDEKVRERAVALYKDSVAASMARSGLYGDVFKRGAQPGAEFLGLQTGIGGEEETEWVVKMKGSPFLDADPTGELSSGQYGYRKIKFFPEETLRAAGVYSPDSTYAQTLYEESTPEELALRKEVGQLETLGALGEYVDVSPSDEGLLESVIGFADQALKLIYPVYNLVSIGVRAIRGETLHLGDYLSAGMSALRVSGQIKPPATVEKAGEAGEAARAAAEASGATAEAAQAAYDATYAAELAGKGLSIPSLGLDLTYGQTVGLSNAIADGNAISFVFALYGEDMLNSTLTKFGVDPATLPSGVREGLIRAVNKVGQGEDWEDALASGAAEWLRSSDLGDEFLGDLRELGKQLDDEYIQPFLELFPDFDGVDVDIPSFGDIYKPIGQIVDGFQEVMSNMADLVPGLSDNAKELADSFIKTMPTVDIESAISKVDQLTAGAFSNLGEGVRDALEDGFRSAIVDGEIDEAAMSRAVSTAVITTEAISEVFPDNITDAASAELITRAVQNSLTTALQGGDPSQAFLKTIATAAAKSAKQALQDGTLGQDVSQFMDKFSGDYNTTSQLREQIDNDAAAYSVKANSYNSLVQDMNAESEALEDLRLTAEATGRQADMDAFQEAKDAFEAKVIDVYAPQLSDLVTDMDTIQDRRDANLELYDASLLDLDDSTIAMNEGLQVTYRNIYEATINELSPNFDAEFYREQNDLPEGVDPYEHYLSLGIAFGTPQNQQAYDAQYDAKFNELMVNAMREAGVNPAKMTDEELQKVRNNLMTVSYTHLRAHET